MSKLALNYSHAARDLLLKGAIVIDCFKCPAWPELVAEAQACSPVMVHFPLIVGSGRGDAINSETGSPVDWQQVERFLGSTDTRHINVHLTCRPLDCPGLVGKADPELAEKVRERIVRDLKAVISRFGRERVIAENVYPFKRESFEQASRAELIAEVVRETGCGFLLDLTHAQLAARYFAESLDHYISKLPLEQIRELHITGSVKESAAWTEEMVALGLSPAVLDTLKEKMLDHLPLSSEDWTMSRWAGEQLRTGRWARPAIVTFEYGGVGELWGELTAGRALQQQTPLVKKYFCA